MKPSREFDKLHGGVRIFQVGFIVALIPLIVLQQIIAGILLIISAQTLVFLTYSFALWKFLSLLNTGPENDKYDRLIRTLRNNAIVVTLFIFIQTVASIFYLVYQSQGWKQVTQPGQVSPYVIVRQVTFFAGTVANLAIYLYIHDIIKGRTERLRSVRRDVLQPPEPEYTLGTANF